jgi:predicted nucleic acid-binding protein
MTSLDSSAIVEYLRNDATVTAYLDERDPWWTSTIRVFEVSNGPASDPVEERQTFGGVRALAFDEQLAIEASRLQHAATEDGTELSPRDGMIAATARSTGDEYVVADSDFEIQPLEERMHVTNLHGDG